MKANALLLMPLLAIGLAGCGTPRTLIPPMTTTSAPPASPAVATIEPDPKADPSPEMSFGMFKAKTAYDSGRYEQALEFFDEALSEEEALPKPRWRQVGYIRYALGRTLQKMDRHEAASEHFKAVLAIVLRHLGPHHLSVVDCHAQIAREYNRRGDFAAQQKHILAALPIWLQHYGPTSNPVLIAFGDLGGSYLAIGDFKRALSFHQAQLGIALVLQGAEGKDIPVMFSNLAQILAKQGEHLKAMEFMEKSMALGIKIHGEQHSQMGLIICNMAKLYMHRPEPDLKKANALLARAEAILKTDDPTGTRRFNYLRVRGNLLLAEKQYQKALRVHEEHLAGTLKLGFAADHPHLARTQYLIGVAHQGLGQESEAKRLFHRAHAIQIRTLLPTHPHLLESKAALAKMGE